VESSCECGNEPSGSIKCWETIKLLHNLWLLEWYSAPQSLLVILIFTFSTVDEKTEGSGLSGSKHYQNSVSSTIPPESNFDLCFPGSS
jgi:hypothetical protein